MPLHHSVLAITFSVVKCLAVILTLFRLGFRLRIQRLWWEDVWAAIASLCAIVSIASIIFVVSGSDDDQRSLIASRINVYMFTNIVWSVRLSLIFSIIRITYPASIRRLALVAAVIFFLFWASTIGLQGWFCKNDSKILPAILPDCVLPRSIVIYQVISSCLADMMTVIYPLKLLWRVKLPPRQRRMVLSLFTTSRFLCLFSLTHSVSQMIGKRSVQAILANVQLGAFLIVCNLLVIVTYCYRVFLKPSDEEFVSGSDPSDDDFSAQLTTTENAANLTTVELCYTNYDETSSESKSVFLSSTPEPITDKSER